MSRSDQARLRAVFARTRGHCHFCGDRLEFESHGRKRWPYPRGAWELDHVIQRHRGGPDRPENYLPACKECNHLRWHRRGADLRELLELGLVAKDEVRRGTALGSRLAGKLGSRRARNRRRRGGVGGGA